MDGKFSDLELLFIAETLDQHGEYLTDLLIEAIEDKSLISAEEKQHLIDSISYKTKKQGINPALIMDFPDYGRLMEINYFKQKRAKNTNAFDQDSLNQALWGRQNSKKAKRRKKDTRWYAKNVYGSLNRLIGIMMYELTDHERARLTNILEKQNLRAS